MARDSGGNLEVFTIEHGNDSIERFVDMLKSAGIVVLIDIRSQSFSRYLPHFKRKALEAAVTGEDITYMYMGDALGGPSAEELEADGGEQELENLENDERFKKGLDRLLGLLDQIPGRVAIMCAEEEPSRCHRLELVAPALEAKGVSVIHIRAEAHWKSKR